MSQSTRVIIDLIIILIYINLNSVCTKAIINFLSSNLIVEGCLSFLVFLLAVVSLPFFRPSQEVLIAFILKKKQKKIKCQHSQNYLDSLKKTDLKKTH